MSVKPSLAHALDLLERALAQIGDAQERERELLILFETVKMQRDRLARENEGLKSDLEARNRELEEWSTGTRQLPRWDLEP